MGIRETINKNPIIPISLSALAIIAAIFFVTREFACDKRPVTGTPQAAYYTTDDGQTWFVDDIYKITPFDKDGKQAVRVHMFTNDGKDRVAGYLSRFSDQFRRELEAVKNEKMRKSMILEELESLSNSEVRRIGPNHRWVKFDPENAAMQQLIEFKGESGRAVPARPGPDEVKK